MSCLLKPVKQDPKGRVLGEVCIEIPLGQRNGWIESASIEGVIVRCQQFPIGEKQGGTIGEGQKALGKPFAVGFTPRGQGSPIGR